MQPEKANMQPGGTNAAALVLATRKAVAVVSMLCRLPGGVESASELWEMLHAGGQAIISPPPKFWETNQAPHLRFGAFLPEDTKRRDSSLLVMLAQSAMSDAKATHNVHLLLCSSSINGTEVAGLVSRTAISRCETIDHISTSSHAALHTACENLHTVHCKYYLH